MSTGRRTAFARTPRNPGAAAALKAQKLIRIDKSFLDNLTQARLEPETSTILTKCEAELVLTIGANGKGNYNVAHKTGRVLADSSDVMKIQSLGSFINEERKAVLKSSVSGSTQKALAAIAQRCIEEPDRDFRAFPRSFLDAYRAIAAQMDTLAANVAAISALEPEGDLNRRVREHLLDTATRTRQVAGEYILYRACLGNDDVPEKLNSALSRAGILSWVFVRLTSQKLQLGGKDFEFRRVYWPKDPTKGLQVTYREWNTPELKDQQGSILQGCRYTAALWNWENTRQFLGFPEDEELNFEGLHKSLAQVPLLVVPPPGGFTAEDSLSALARSGDKGLSWQVGTTTKPQDTLKFLGTVPRRVALGLVSRPALKTDLITRIYTGFDATAEGEGVYPKLHKQFKDGRIATTWLEQIPLGTTHAIATMRLVARDIIGVTDGVLADTVNASCNRNAAPGQGDGIAAHDVWAELMAAKMAITDERSTEILANRADPTWFSKKKKKSREVDFRSARSQLGPAASALVGELKRRRYKELAERVEAWLRTYLTVDVQSAVSEVVMAKLDASLSRPVEFGREDRIAVMQPIDVESDEEVDEEAEVAEANPDEE